MRRHTFRVALLLALAIDVAIPRITAAQTPGSDATAVETQRSGDRQSSDEMRCVCGSAMQSAMHGPFGVIVSVLAGVLLLAFTSALLGLTLFLIRRSRVPGSARAG